MNDNRDVQWDVILVCLCFVAYFVARIFIPN